MWEAEKFWQFSFRHYSDASVKESCLTLQEDYGFNVNILLLCVFMDSCKQQICLTHFSRLTAAIASLDTVIANKRTQRKNVKSLEKARFQELLKEELLLEKQQQAMLIDVLRKLDLTLLKVSNLNIYQQYMRCTQDKSALQLCQKIKIKE